MKVHVFFLAGSDRLFVREKTIMLVGATGSGKSTLIDGFANYLFDVNWDDPFRFTLVDLEREEKRRLSDQVCVLSTNICSMFKIIELHVCKEIVSLKTYLMLVSVCIIALQFIRSPESP
jgi:ABC-type nitrate/sulfonate/bicarbonate transport system ATPase subunit